MNVYLIEPGKFRPARFKRLVIMTYDDIVKFVTDKKGFVDPEKVESVNIYGLEKAKKMWKDGEPDFSTRMNLFTIACKKALLGIL